MTFVRKFFNLFLHSFVNRVLQNTVCYIQKLLRQSLIVRFFASYEKYENAVSESFCFKKISSIYNLRRKKLHGFFAGVYENSRFYTNLKKISVYIKGMQAGQFGAGIFSLGVTSAIIGISLYYTHKVPELFNERLVLGLLVCIFSVAFIGKRNVSLSNLLLSSRMVRFFIINVAGVREETLDVNPVKEKNYVKAFFYGAVIALPLVFFNFYSYLIGIIAFIFLIIILNSPEFGLISILFAIPFLKVLYLMVLTLTVFISLIFKTVRGKRYIKFTILDFAVFLFGICLLYSLSVSVNLKASLNQTTVFLVFILIYFLCSKLINTKKYAYLSASALLISVAISAFIGVYGNIFGNLTAFVGIDTHLFFEIKQTLTGPFDNGVVYGQFLAALLPLAIAFFFIKSRFSRWSACFVAIIMIISLYHVNSKTALVAAAIGTVLFVLLYNSFFVKLFIVGILALPFTVSHISINLNKFTDSSFYSKYAIWQGSFRLAKEVWTTGIGTGSGAFILAYPMFAVSEAANALHSHNLFLQIIIDYGITGAIVFFCIVLIFASLIITSLMNVKDVVIGAIILAMGCGMLTLLIGAITDNIWYNSKIYLLFFAFIGIAQGSYNAYKKLRRENL